MNPEPTTTSSWDYLVELSDDGKQSDQQESEIIVIPPAPPATSASSFPSSAPEERPHGLPGNVLPMSMEGSVAQWLGQLKAGDPVAVQKLWENYFQKLVVLARKRLRGMPRGPADEEDIALSALDSLCRGAERGQFSGLQDRDDLWQLLSVITARKVIDLKGREQRQSRAIPKAAGPRAEDWQSSAEGGWNLERIISQEPTPEFATQIAEEWQRLLDKLGDDKLRSVAIWKMEGHTNEEIARLLGLGTRTVKRKLRVIRGLWEKEI